MSVCCTYFWPSGAFKLVFDFIKDTDGNSLTNEIIIYYCTYQWEPVLHLSK